MSHETTILASQVKGSSIALPAPRVPITIRPGTLDDLPFIDALQKKQTKQLGFMHRATLEGKIKLGHVLIAVGAGFPRPGVGEEGGETPPLQERLGYLIGNDQYFKRDDVGIIYQINVAEGNRRGLIGAMLLKAQFDRSAYGCKLYCCWCAQDIEANRFWEACGFVPLAYRAGSEKKQRTHIFWSKRIREGDTTTPWWFPSLTAGGAMMEERLVFPIPPGTHWSDCLAIVLPKDTQRDDTQPKQIEDAGAKRKTNKKAVTVLAIARKPVPLCGGLTFQSPAPTKPQIDEKNREKKPKIKNDPRFVAAARELRDRWLERVNAGEYLPAPAGKYDLTRALPDRLEMQPVEAKQIGYQPATSVAA